jgi:hypothetical protein
MRIESSRDVRRGRGVRRGGRRQDAPAIGRCLGPAYPTAVSAAKADRIVWLAYRRGQRNVYTAAAPAPAAAAHTLSRRRWHRPDDLSISADGSVVSVRGTGESRRVVAKRKEQPRGLGRAVGRAPRAARVTARRGTAPVVSPDGRYAAFAKDGQIYRVRVMRRRRRSPMDKALCPSSGMGEQQSPLVARQFESPLSSDQGVGSSCVDVKTHGDVCRRGSTATPVRRGLPTAGLRSSEAFAVRHAIAAERRHRDRGPGGRRRRHRARPAGRKRAARWRGPAPAVRAADRPRGQA